MLPDLDLTIPAGQTLALVGTTGAGKTTLAKLATRFYDPIGGRVLLDGVDLRDLSDETLHRAVVMVTQENYLFSGTIADNIRFGRPTASIEDVVAATTALGADGFIRELPLGYETEVSNRGGVLSAGQRQLVAFARAFLADPAVLILDEATSSLDIPSERLVQRALRTILAGRTAVIIAHRLSTVEIADRVLVMEHGRIVEDGSPGRPDRRRRRPLLRPPRRLGRLPGLTRLGVWEGRSVADLGDLGVVETVRLTSGGEVSTRAVVDAALERIERLDRRFNAFTVVLAEQARAEADERDAALARGETAGSLHGVPVAIKEEIDVAGCVTTFGGRANTTPVAADSEVVRRLRAAGAVVIGKTAMPEFGSFPFTESEATGYTLNPWDVARSPGGSSGGTAVAVAAGLVPVGIGGDGGGSIRVPSSFCGLFGLKPQRGRVSTAPHPHLWWALGVVGPLARSVADSALVYDVIRGNLPSDRFRAGGDESFVAAAAREPGPAPGRLVGEAADPRRTQRPVHVRAVEDTARLLADLGHDVREIDVRYPDPTFAFVPQFFAGIRTEADEVEHYDRLERRTRETYRLGAWVRPGVLEWALRRTETYSAKAQPRLRRRRRAADAGHGSPTAAARAS